MQKKAVPAMPPLVLTRDYNTHSSISKKPKNSILGKD